MFGVTADVMPFPMFFIKRESRCDVCVGCVTCFLGNKYFQVIFRLVSWVGVLLLKW